MEDIHESESHPAPLHERRGERGIALIAVIIVIPALLAMTVMAVEVGHIAMVKSELAAAADAAAIAGAYALPDEFTAKSHANSVSDGNYGTGVHTESVDVGRWEEQTRTFAANVNPFNAVRVITRRSAAGGNPTDLIVGEFIGLSTANIEAVAIATNGDEGGGDRFRFLIDDEMFDTDVEEIEDLADDLGVSPDTLLSDNDGDWFIDLPAGTELELPTGQVGDEGIFDINESTFRFSETSSPSLEDFLNYSSHIGWRNNLVPDSMLDPLVGVNPVSNGGQYQSFVNPDVVLVSPVYKSDVSNLGRGKVNAKGERRGLVAFSIIAVGSDPDGSGSKLPNLIIRIADPGDVDIAGVGIGGGGGGSGSVKLVM